MARTGTPIKAKVNWKKRGGPTKVFLWSIAHGVRSWRQAGSSGLSDLMIGGAAVFTAIRFRHPSVCRRLTLLLHLAADGTGMLREIASVNLEDLAGDWTGFSSVRLGVADFFQMFSISV